MKGQKTIGHILSYVYNKNVMHIQKRTKWAFFSALLALESEFTFLN